MNKKTLIAMLVLATLPLLPFNNCSKMDDNATESNNNVSVEGLPEVNYLKQPKPAIICGKDGYGYLLTEYFKPNCGACHGAGGISSPAMADASLDISFNGVKLVSGQALLDTIADNKFCGPDCNLDPRGDVYKAVEEWLEHPFVCP